MSAARLSKEQKDQIAYQYLIGINVKVIAKDFGVHHSYPSLLARRRGLITRAGLTNTRYPKDGRGTTND